MAKLSETLAIRAIGALAGSFATVLVGGFTYLNQDRTLDIRMLEIALGILREDPNQSNIAAARGWAVDIIGENSGRPISEEARNELVETQLKFSWAPTMMSYQSDMFAKFSLAEPLLQGWAGAIDPAAVTQALELLNQVEPDVDGARALLEEIETPKNLSSD